MQILPDRIIYDRQDFLAGLIPDYSNNSVRFGVAGASFAQKFDPYNSVPGVAQPGRLPSSYASVSTEPDALLVAAVTDDVNGGSASYAIGGKKLHKIDPVNEALIVTNWPHTIVAEGAHSSGTHTIGSDAFALGDLVMYNNAGTALLMFSYNDDTDWDVGSYDLSSTPPTGVDEDFMSTTPTTPLGTTAADLTGGQGKDHPLYVAQTDGILYMGSGRYVHAYDGVNNTFISKDLDINSGFEVVGFAETNYDLVVFGTTARSTGRLGKSYAFFWDASRPSAAYKLVDLIDNKVTAPFNFQGTVGCFTQGRNQGAGGTPLASLRLYNGRIFEPVKFFTGNAPGRRGVFVGTNAIFWISDGKIHVWGQPQNEYPIAFHHLTSGQGSTNGGFLTSLLVGAFAASSGTGSSGGLDEFNNFHSSAGWQSLTAAPNFPPGKIGRLKQVLVRFATTAASGRALDIDLVLNGVQTTVELQDSLETVTAATMTKRYQIDKNGKELEANEFTNLKLNLTWATGSGSSSAPMVEKVEIFYDTVESIAI